MIRILKYLLLFWILYGCSDDGTSPRSGNPNTGISGSTARFAIAGNALYVVDRTRLNVFDITTPAKPEVITQSNIGSDVETIFVRGNVLFIGSTSGVQIFDASNPHQVKKLGDYTRFITLCDPVVANDSFAFASLSTARTNCSRGNNVLEVLNITDITKPSLVKEYGMTSPKGLALLGNRLFLCDNGLKIYDVSHADSIVLKKQYFMNATDVIALPQSVLITGSNGLVQYTYSNDSLQYQSQIAVYLNQ